MQSSADIFVVIDGQTFAVNGKSLIPQSRSDFELEVLRRLDSLDHEQKAIREELSAVKEEQKVMREELAVHASILADVNKQLAVQTAKIDGLHYWGSIAFTLLAAVIAFVGMLAPKFWEHVIHRENSP